MLRKLDPMAPLGVLCGWLAAVVGLQSGLIVAVGGQAVGSLIGGCGWIGFSTPIHLQAWALVNQPSLDFASQPGSLGYWLGSLILALAVGVTTVGFVPRPRTLATELWAVQLAWGATAIGIAWLPLLDSEDGHLSKWLKLQGLPDDLVWLAPLIAVAASVPPTLRLLALVRSVRPHAGRRLRIAAVVVHLATPCLLWVALATILRGSLPIQATAGLAAPILTAVVIAHVGYPAPYPHRLTEIGWGSAARLTIAAVVLGTLLWVGGRPLPDGGCSGLLWGKPGSYNNIRSWIHPMAMPLPWNVDP
jgi:hypothetical protein